MKSGRALLAFGAVGVLALTGVAAVTLPAAVASVITPTPISADGGSAPELRVAGNQIVTSDGEPYP